MVHPIKVQGNRITLREFNESDTSALHQIYGDPVVTHHLSFEPRTIDQVKSIISDSMRTARNEPRIVYMLAVVAKDSGRVIGSARLAIDERPHSAQIGFALDAREWGHGLGTETVNLLLRLGFEQLSLHRIWAARSPDNLASDGLLRKVGFIEEGRMRHHVSKRGEWRDSIAYSILDDEWKP